ncbi:hypothetical protein VPH35_020752 [Triticum aestivum]
MVALCRLPALLFPGVRDLKIWHRELSSSTSVLCVWESNLPGSSSWTSFVIKDDSYRSVIALIRDGTDITREIISVTLCLGSTLANRVADKTKQRAFVLNVNILCRSTPIF